MFIKQWLSDTELSQPPQLVLPGSSLFDPENGKLLKDLGHEPSRNSSRSFFAPEACHWDRLATG